MEVREDEIDAGSTNSVDEVKVEPDASTIPIVENGRIVVQLYASLSSLFDREFEEKHDIEACLQKLKT